MINTHPPASGFPFAFIVLLIVLEILQVRFRSAIKREFIEMVLFAFCAGLLLSFFSGYHGLEYVDTRNATVLDHVSVHHSWAKALLFVSPALLCTALLAPRAKKNQRFFWVAYYCLLCITVLLTTLVSFLGGQLVFVHGAGVAS